MPVGKLTGSFPPIQDSAAPFEKMAVFEAVNVQTERLQCWRKPLTLHKLAGEGLLASNYTQCPSARAEGWNFRDLSRHFAVLARRSRPSQTIDKQPGCIGLKVIDIRAIEPAAAGGVNQHSRQPHASLKPALT